MAGSKHANKTSFGKGNTAARNKGRNFKTKLLEVIREEAMLEATPDMDNDTTEKLFLKHWIGRAFDMSDPNSAMLLREAANKSYGNIKPMLPNVSFEFDDSIKPAEQAALVMKAAASGLISPDVSQVFINNIATMLKIEEVTEIQERLAEIEKSLGVSGA